MILGYLLISDNQDDLTQQKDTINKYVKLHNIDFHGFIEQQNKEKRVDVIFKNINMLTTSIIVTEISKLGKNLLESLNILDKLIKSNIDVIFVNQSELNTLNNKDIKKIFKYFLESEKSYISHRTKKGLEVARAKGRLLGRPKGKKNKNRILDAHHKEILHLLNTQLSVNGILKYLKAELQVPISYTALKYYIEHDKILKKARDNFKRGSLFS